LDEDPNLYLTDLSFIVAKAEIFGLESGILITLILLLLSALLSASEVAFFSVKSHEIDALKESKATLSLTTLLENPRNLLATILILNNMVNIGIVVITDGIIHSLDLFHLPGWAQLLIQVAAVTALILLFGEIIPKVYATKNHLRISLLMAFPMGFMVKAMKPFYLPLTGISKLIDRNLKKRDTNLSVSELSHALEITGMDESNDESHKILKGIVEFGNIDVSAIMTPRVNTAVADAEWDFTRLIQFIKTHGYSRIPVFEENYDNIIGVIYIKDILPFLNTSDEVNWKTLIRKPFFVPESKKLDDLLTEFQQKKMHIAIVVDEFGGFSGVVTLEDVIEEIVGEINDEFDDDVQDIKVVNDSTYIMDGHTSLNDFIRCANLEDDYFDDVKGDADTVAGVILEMNGNIPAKKDIIKFKQLKIEILSADQRRIRKLKITLEETEEKASDAMNGLSSFVILVVIAFTLLSCGGEKIVSPKPKGFMEIALPAKQYRLYENDCPYTFEYPVYAKVEPYTGPQQSNCWMNMVFPQFRSKIYLTYQDIGGQKVEDFLEDSRSMAYKHAVKASGIDEIEVLSKQNHLYGIIYNIEGDVASGYQFHVTDCVKHFLRGSLYFDIKTDKDSVQPVSDFLKQDVNHLVESVRWKN
jgi:gliding motility-associated lipoprotein GldD